MERQQRVVVAGGAGFIGSHLCRRLLADGQHVVALDDLSTGDERHLDALRGHDDFALVRVDVAQAVPGAIERAAQIVNLACPASPAHYQQEPIHTVVTSALGTWRLLEAAGRSGARLLQASTSEVYGDPQCHPQREDYRGHVNPVGPRSCYHEGQRCAEAMCVAYHRERGVDVGIARLFDCYGPRLMPGDGRVVSNFIIQALRGDPLTIHGDGRQTRSFCYIDDMVEGLVRLLRSSVREPVNLGSPIEHTVLELAERVLRLCGSRSGLHLVPRRADDPQRRRPEITRARACLGWEPRVSLDDGLRETIDHFRHQLGRAPRHVLPAAPPAAPLRLGSTG